jgi:minor histocompatibility antigen H13
VGLALITAVACFLPVPVPLHLLSVACATIYIGSYNSTLAESKEAGEQMETKDVYMFPVFGSILLFSLYAVFKLLDKDYINLIIRAYAVVFGVLVLAQKLSQIMCRILPEDQTKALTAKSFQFNVPYMSTEKSAQVGVETVPYTLDLHILDFVGLLVAIGAGSLYVKHNHWALTNLFGIAFSIQGIELLGLGSYLNGAIFLSGLFVYDVFWVFGTEVMVTVAKNFDAPVKMLFPQMNDTLVNGVLQNRPSMLGLGDIVVPGLFIALMLRFDLTRQQGKPEVEMTRDYFRICLLGYFLGLATTVFVMYYFEAAQPALLYLSPACLGSSLLLALFRGEVRQLLSFKEDAKEKRL